MPHVNSSNQSQSEITPRGTFTHIGSWALGPTLGRGAYAHVRLATHMPTGRRSACKILPALHQDKTKPVTWDQTVDAIEAHKEVVLLKALSGIKLSGVVELEGVIEKDGWTYMFSTIHPQSVAQVPEPWPHDRMINFFRRLCLTVQSLHQLGISHEDIKRSNALVDKIWCPALIDFGFSHFSPYGHDVRSAGGTLDYSSPEKVADGMYNGPATDVWSLGILLCKLLGLPHPYLDVDNDTESQAKNRIMQGQAQWHFSDQHYSRGGAASLVGLMLEHDPERRLTISEVLDHPFLFPDRLDPPPIRFPSMTPLKPSHALPVNIIEDVCFLAFLIREFFLCETSQRIVQRIYGSKPCWEQRWAKMLDRWRQREEMDWEDVPKAALPPMTRGRAPLIPPRSILREIKLDAKGNADRSHAQAAPEVPKVKAKHAHEALGPAVASRLVTAEHSPKRSKRVQAVPQPILSPKKISQRGLVTNRAPTRPLITVTKPRVPAAKATTTEVPERPARRPASRAHDIDYPVLIPDQKALLSSDGPGESSRVKLGEPIPPNKPAPHSATSLKILQDLALDIPPLEDEGGPRRSTRIAARGLAAKGLR